MAQPSIVAPIPEPVKQIWAQEAGRVWRAKAVKEELPKLVEQRQQEAQKWGEAERKAAKHKDKLEAAESIKKGVEAGIK